MSKLQTNQLQHTANGAAVYTLPQTDGSAGDYLQTNGSGVLSWVTPTAADNTPIFFLQKLKSSFLVVLHCAFTTKSAKKVPKNFRGALRAP